MEVVEHHLFRVTRNADLEVEEDRDEDLLQALERELVRRRFGPAVRLEVAESMDERVLELLVRELEVDPADVQRLPGLLDLSGLWELYDLDVPRLKDPAATSRPATRRWSRARRRPTSSRPCATGDVLVQPPLRLVRDVGVQRFIEQAAGRTPGRARHQADALPDQRRQPHRRRARRGGRGRQAGRRPRRAEGPLRRGQQHPAGRASWSAPAATSSTASSV